MKSIRRKQGRTWLGAVGALVALGALTVLHGVLGFVGGVAIGLSWYMLPSVYAFTIGQFVVIAVIPGNGTSLVQVWLLELGLISILVEPGVTQKQQLRKTVLIGLGISLGVSLVWEIVDGVRPLWQSVLVLAVIFMTLTYGLHRYEQLELGLIEEAP
ncbi:hypothetical protein M0R88_10480 [Halorussus gelatinilyticus]|uniref:DUF8163 domain-containing protein n=1 Tax=Halorussus gelatinilyticus TaxID=2937524 RepID=A0A8U0IF75_9EURY|nr:hypothetical protein [Halorussus gelatinilyticus]UPV98953.1 hypothetical protein M0R88_10480 [Halorussus gelatinilyticus]